MERSNMESTETVIEGMLSVESEAEVIIDGWAGISYNPRTGHSG